MVNEVHGHIATVVREVDGDELTAAAATGATVLAVRDVADFDEDGGTVRLDDGTSTDLPDGGGTLREYVAITDAPPTITLTTPIPAALAAGTRVDVWDTDENTLTVVYKATVIDDVTGEPLDADVSHDLIDKLDSSVRDGTAESVVCREDESGRWSVVDVLGRVPVGDGSFIDEETLPIPDPTPPIPPATPDLYEPETAAYVVGQVPWSRVTLEWPAVGVDVDGTIVTDVVAYEVHGSRDGADYVEVARVDGTTTSVVLSQLQPGITWSFRLRAIRDNGLQSASAWSFPRSITTAIGQAPAATPAIAIAGGIGALVVSTTGSGAGEPTVLDVWVSPTLPVSMAGAPTLSLPGNGPAVNFVRTVNGAAVSPSTTYYARARLRNAWGNAPELAGYVAAAPLYVNTPDLAANAITVNLLIANDALIDALQVTDFTGLTVTGATLRTASVGDRVVVEQDDGEAAGVIRFFLNTNPNPAQITSWAPTGSPSESGLEISTAVGSGPEPARLRLASGVGGQWLELWAINQWINSEDLLVEAAGGADVRVGPDGFTLRGTPTFPWTMRVGTGTTDRPSLLDVWAVATRLRGTLQVDGTLAATMSDGSVGTGAFRTSVDARVTTLVPARQYVEVELSSAYDTTTSQTPLPGMTLNVVSTGLADMIEVVAFFDIQTVTGSSSSAVGQLRVDGVAQSRSVIYSGPTTGMRGTAGQTWRLTSLTAGTHSLTLYAYRTASAGAYRVQPTHTVLSAKRISGT